MDKDKEKFQASSGAGSTERLAGCGDAASGREGAPDCACLAQRRPSAAVKPLGAGARGTRLGPPAFPRPRPHAHAQLPVAAGRPPAGLL